MKDLFVPHAQSLQLKELGFEEPCLAYYYNGGEIEYRSHTNNIMQRFRYAAPTFSQAFRWFREKCELRNSITDFIDDKTGIDWDYEIAVIGTDLDEKGNYKSLVDYSTDDETRKFKTYEEAELACLKKLIQIIKTK